MLQKEVDCRRCGRALMPCIECGEEVVCPVDQTCRHCKAAWNYAAQKDGRKRKP